MHVTEAAAEHFAEILELEGAPKDLLIHIVVEEGQEAENSDLGMKLDRLGRQDAVFMYGGKAVLAIDEGLAQTLDNHIVDVEETDNESTLVIALIDHHPRYARIGQAHLETRIVLDDTGFAFAHVLRWEYQVRILNHSDAEANQVIIAEQTIICEVESDQDADFNSEA